MAYQYCVYHGKCNHTTEACKDIKRLIAADKRGKRDYRNYDKKKRAKVNKKHEYKKRSSYVKRSEVHVLSLIHI